MTTTDRRKRQIEVHPLRRKEDAARLSAVYSAPLSQCSDAELRQVQQDVRSLSVEELFAPRSPARSAADRTLSN